VRSSGQDGAGSTFYFTLPIVPSPANQAQRRATSQLHQESVLVLASRAESSSQLRQHLAERGFDVQVVSIHQTSDWQSRLMVSLPGAIAVDMSATPQQGWQVVRSIKGHPRTQHLPVLLYSLSHEGGSVLEFDYLTKPFELSALARALDQHWLVPETGTGRKTILVVDDDLDTLEIHVRMVQAHSSSHRVLGARNGLEALDTLQREHVDLVLLDLIMPELDGFDVLKAMRERQATCEIPVIVLTGQVLTSHDMDRLNQGVATVLSKGVFSVQETLEHIDTTLEHNRKLSSETQRLVRQAMAYVHEHYADPISRSDLARHVALSDDYLTFCFRKELGVTPIAYLHRYRVNQAKQLLTQTSKSITEIALEVGFSDSSYFGRIFQREVGVSPQAYR
jgi:YesN/AraC family two-component response regulator